MYDDDSDELDDVAVDGNDELVVTRVPPTHAQKDRTPADEDKVPMRKTKRQAACLRSDLLQCAMKILFRLNSTQLETRVDATRLDSILMLPLVIYVTLAAP